MPLNDEADRLKSVSRTHLWQLDISLREISLDRTLATSIQPRLTMNKTLAVLALASTIFMTPAHAQSTAEKIFLIPCQAITTNAVSNMSGAKYRSSEAWGIPYVEWDIFAFNALKARARECNVRVESGMMDIPSLIQVVQGTMAPAVEQHRSNLNQQATSKNLVIKKLDAIPSTTSPVDGIKILQELKKSSEYISLSSGDRELGSNDRQQVDVALDTKLERFQEAEVVQRMRAERERKVRAAQQEAMEAQQAAEKAETEIKERQTAAVAAEESARRREANQAAIMKEEEDANAQVAAALALKQQAAERAAKANAANASSSRKEGIARNKEAAMVAEEQRAEQSLQQLKRELSEKQECSVAKKVVEIEQPTLAGSFSKFPAEFQAGMREEGCKHIASAYVSAERMRKSLASCEPSAAIDINKVVEGMRELGLEQGCGRLQ